MSEVVITATPYPGAPIDFFFNTPFGGTLYGYEGTYTGIGGGSTSTAVQGTSTPGHHEIHTYVVDANNTASADKVRVDADKLGKAVAIVDDAFAHADLSKIVYTPVGQMTLGQVKDIWDRTSFYVSDQPKSFFDNGGVGGIHDDGYGGFKDTILIDGFNNMTGGTGGYDSPAYQNNEGLVGLVLHEISHELPGAQQQYQEGYSYYIQEHNGSSVGYSANSDYWLNNEAFANQGEMNISAVLDTNTYAYDQNAIAQYGVNWQPPGIIHADHTGGNPNAVTGWPGG